MRPENGLKAMVLAAGVGSRLDPLTRQFPKPMVPFVNRPVMEHIVRLLHRHGITRAISNLHYLPDKVPSYFGDGSRFGLEMNYVVEEKLSGDAGGVRACREYLEDDTFLVVMGDLITDLDLSYIVRQHREKGALATLALKQVTDVDRFGVAVLNSNGFITEFQEKPSKETAKTNLASTGIYVLEPQIFEYMGSSAELGFGRQLFPQLIARELPVLGVEVWGYWSDVGTVGQYRSSTLDAVEGFIDLALPGEPFESGWKGDNSEISERCLIEGVVLLGSNSYIGNNVRIKGCAVIGDNCLIDDGVEIENSIVWPGSVIGANTRLKNSVVGANCFIESNSSLFEKATVEPTNPFDAERMQKLLDTAKRQAALKVFNQTELDPVLDRSDDERADELYL